VVNYPVTVQLANAKIADVRPGMTAVATILDDEASAGWLVPTSALVEREGNTMVIVLRDGQPTRIPVTSAGSQGEWTVVQSDELVAGDEAVGGVSSFLNQGDAAGGFGPPGGGPGFGGGRPQ
jgi:multidrug efflux pump subunit AcrA (membrane-fusion protein)